MTSSPVPRAHELLATARSHAIAGGWEDVRRTLSSNEDVALAHPELATLRAEAELWTGHPREARTWLTAALPRIQRSGDRAALRKAVNYLGVADVELGALDEAQQVFGRVLELAQLDGDDLMLARATNNLGTIANIRGDRAKALTLYQLAIPAYQRLGNTRGLAESLHNIAISYRYLGQLARADEYEQQAIHYAREAGIPRLLALGQLERAEISLKSGDAELAEAGARRASIEFSALSDKLREGDALRLVGAAALARGRFEVAREALDTAVTLSRVHESPLNEAEALFVRAQLFAASRDIGNARGDARQSASIYERLGASVEKTAVEEWIAKIVVSATE
jgi:tetratricopeptide (TPR) repeat protein